MATFIFITNNDYMSHTEYISCIIYEKCRSRPLGISILKELLAKKSLFLHTFTCKLYLLTNKNLHIC